MAGKRAAAIAESRKRVDWAQFTKRVPDEECPDANQAVLVMDNLSTHGIASLHEAFPPEEALRLAPRLEIHMTPKHGSWLNMAETELSALAGQCLDRRMPDMEAMRKGAKAWAISRNKAGADIT